MYDTHSVHTFNWLKNQNKIYGTLIKEYFDERESDINTLAANISLLSSLVSNNTKVNNKYLNTFMSNYGYQSLLVFNEDKEKVYYEFGYGNHDQESFFHNAVIISNRLDNKGYGAVVFDYFIVDGKLFGVVGKKSTLESGKSFYYFLTINNEKLNDILFSSSFYVEGSISYLVNKNSNGDYFFLTDITQGGKTYKYGDSAESIPIYWKYADQNVLKDSYIYKDLTGDKALVAYTRLNELDEDFILISKIQSKYIINPLFEYSYYISFGIVLVLFMVLFFSNKIKDAISLNLTNIMRFCSDLISGEGKIKLKLSEFHETNAIKQSLIGVAKHLDEDSERKGYEIKIEKDLRTSKDLTEFSRKAILIVKEVFDIKCAAFYLKKNDEFELLSQYFCNMENSISSDKGVVTQCYDLNIIHQVEASIFNEAGDIKGANIDIHPHVLLPRNYIFVPIVASKDSLSSGMIIGALDNKLNHSQLDFLEKIRVNLALIMSFVAQKENLNKLFEQTKIREKELDQLNEELTLLSRNDSLTGIANRFYGEYLLEKTLKNKAEDSALPLSVLMFDVDHFKAYNDSYGHVAGDKCLQKIAQCVKEMGLRTEDFFFRYGGEEFVVVLPGTSTKNAMQVAERLRKSIQDMAILHEYSPTSKSVTVSVGVYTLTRESADIESVAQLIHQVDKNLYLAKNKRNSIFCGEVES
ncbi:GGDEF domain-containing protein [Vibrio alginolyticus]